HDALNHTHLHFFPTRRSSDLPHNDGECSCRKPEIGMFLQAERDCPVDKNRSWMIGDSGSDIEAGKNYGVKTIYIGDSLEFGADMVVSSLFEAVKKIKLLNQK